jgi:hypothetical protein
LHIFFFLKIAFIADPCHLSLILTNGGLLRDPKGGLVGASTSFSQKRVPNTDNQNHYSLRSQLLFLSGPSLAQTSLARPGPNKKPERLRARALIICAEEEGLLRDPGKRTNQPFQTQLLAGS